MCSRQINLAVNEPSQTALALEVYSVQLLGELKWCSGELKWCSEMYQLQFL